MLIYGDDIISELYMNGVKFRIYVLFNFFYILNCIESRTQIILSSS